MNLLKLDKQMQKCVFRNYTLKNWRPKGDRDADSILLVGALNMVAAKYKHGYWASAHCKDKIKVRGVK
jgi:hypothetical protein